MSEYGLILSPDGSKSFFEIGAWKALREMDIELSTVAGEYMGAINAALIAQGDFENAVRFWNAVVKNKAFDVNKKIAEIYEEDWSKQDDKYFKKAFTKFIAAKNNPLTPLKETLEEYLDEREIRGSDVRMNITTVSLSEMQPENIMIEDIPKGKLISYLLTAYCYPRIASAKETRDEAKKAMISSFLEDGCGNIMCTDEETTKLTNLTSAKAKYIRSSAFESVNEEYSSDSMKKNIIVGYLDTLKSFGKLKGKFYNIVADKDSPEYDSFKNRLGSSLPGNISLLQEAILLQKNITKDVFQEKADALINKTSFKGEDTSSALLENLANILEIDKNEKLSYDEMLSNITNISEELWPKNIEKLKDSAYLSKLMNEVPSYPDMNKDTFIQYFLILISTKPESFSKISKVIEELPVQAILGILALIYIAY